MLVFGSVHMFTLRVFPLLNQHQPTNRKRTMHIYMDGVGSGFEAGTFWVVLERIQFFGHSARIRHPKNLGPKPTL